MPLPMRILVKGPSTVLLTSMMGGPRSDLGFPRVIEQQLLAKGRSAQVRNGAVGALPTHDMFNTWDDEILAWSPDVVILCPGHMDMIHIILPRWLERGANSFNRRPGRVRHYRRLFLRLMARGVLLVQKRIDRPDRQLKKRTLRRVIRDTTGYIEMTQKVGSPLILLMGTHPPAESKVKWYGGIRDRQRRTEDALRSLAATHEQANVRFVEIIDLMEKFDPGDPEHLWPDGIHFSPEFHRAIGEKFADIVEAWATTQPHLAQP